jgi:hypothetical protein
MSHSRHRDSLRMPAPRWRRTGKSSRHARGGSGALGGFVLPAGLWEIGPFEPLNLHHGAHLTTRLAAWSQVASRSGPASYQPCGTGARRRLSPSPSKQSHPPLYSLATSRFRWNGFFRRSGVRRRSEKPVESAAPPLALRRSAFRLSAESGVTSQTSHRFPLESTKVR